MPAKVIKIHSTIIIKGALVSNAHWKNSISVFFFHPHLRNANVNPWRWRYSKRHASASPSDAHGNKILKALNMWGSLSAEEPPSQNISATKEGKKIHTHTHQSTQGLYKERSVVAKRQMQNNLHEKPDHDPFASSSSQTVSPSPTQLLPNIKAHLCHIKAEKQGCWGRGGIHGVCFNKKLHRRFWIIP